MVSNKFKQHGAYIGVILLNKWVTISLTLFGLQYDVWTQYSHPRYV